MDRKIIYGTGALLFVGAAAWFGFRGGSSTPNPDKGDPDRFATLEAIPLSTPTGEASSTPINTSQSTVIYAADNTPFKVISTDPLCAEVGGPFENQPGKRHNAGRLAQALGNGVITFNINGQLITIDTDADPYPSQLNLVHADDSACK